MAPKARKTLLAIRNGVLEGSTTTLIHCWPTGKNTARFPVTVLSFPKRKFTEHGASRMFCLTCFGRCRQSSTNWSWPMTDMLAPKSTIPEDPWDTKQAVSTGFKLPVTVGRRGSAGGGMLSAFSSVVGLFLQRACSRLVRSGRILINWDFNGSGFQLYLTALGGKNLLGMYGLP